MPGKKCSNWVAGDFRDLFEAELPMMAQLNNFSIPLRELLHRRSQLRHFCHPCITLGVIQLGFGAQSPHVLRCRGGRVPRTLAAIVPNPVHRDPEEPGLELTLLTVPAAVALPVEFGRDRDEY